MEDFVYNPKTKIIFGKGKETVVGSEVKNFVGDGKVLLHYGGGSIKKSGLYDKVVSALNEQNIEFVELDGVKPNPRLSLVEQGIALCRTENVTFILAVGGGSVIDSAKGIALGAKYSGDDMWEKFYVDMQPVTNALPIGTILTIPAAGSESSPGSVVTNETTGRKLYAIGEALLPRFSILNPELTMTVPAYQTACGSADILAHIMERYFTHVESVEVTDQLCEGTMRAVIEIAPKILAEPNHYGYRAELMFAGMIAHNDSLGLGRIGDWMTHDTEHELSAIWDIPHGEGLAILFPAWITYVWKNNPARFTRFAEQVFGITEGSDEERVMKSVSALKSWYHSLALKTSLKEIGITDESKFELMAENCVGSGSRGHMAELSKEDIINIFQLAL